MSATKALSHLISRKISARIALNGFVWASVLAMAAVLIQLTLEINSHNVSIKKDLNQIISVATLPAKNAIYNFDYDLANEVAKSLLLADFIESVEILSEHNEALAQKNKDLTTPFRIAYLVPLIGEPIHKVTVPISFNAESPEQLGALNIQYNNHKPYVDLMQVTWQRLLLNFIEMGLLMLVLIFIFNRLITQPLAKVSDQLTKFDLHNQRGIRIKSERGHRQDEIGILIDALNAQFAIVDTLIDKNHRALKEANDSYVSLHALVENLPHLITVKNTDGIALLANRVFLKTFSISESDFIGQKTSLSVLAHLSKSTQQIIADADEAALHSNNSVLLPEIDWRMKNGKYYSFEMRKLAIQYKGEDAILTVGFDITERKRHQSHIQHMAYHDSLTDLPNRQLFIDRLEQALLRTHRAQGYGALIFVDLDDFKAINDQRGHLTGDTVLMEVAQRLRTQVREGDTVARLGGDEFVICMTDVGPTETEARTIGLNRAQRIIAALQQPVECQDEFIQMSASLGLAFFHDHSITASDLLKHADMAMYKAKESGKNRFVVFENQLAEANLRLSALKVDCQVAVEKQQLFLMYQPQYDTHLNKITGAEALLRWAHPVRGMISPAEFIPLFEEGDLMPLVGEFVLQQAIAQGARWYHAGLIHDDFKLCINVSPQQFRHADFTRIVIDTIRQQNIPASLINLEITEGMIIDNIDHTVNSMNQLKDLGVHFSIDDFGTGYSNLNYLKRLPLDVLKVDQSFVRDIQKINQETAIVGTIIAMAEQLNLQTVAEGVETEVQLTTLKNLGCHIFQGYLYAPPLKIVELEDLILQQRNSTQHDLQR